MAQQLRYGVIGCGRISNSHFGALKKIEEVRIVAAADISAEALAQRKTEFGLERTYSDWNELLADRDIEIVADRGIAARVAQSEWEAICRAMEAELRAGRYEAGALAGIERVSDLVARHFPPGDRDRNELPDAPVVIG